MIVLTEGLLSKRDLPIYLITATMVQVEIGNYVCLPGFFLGFSPGFRIRDSNKGQGVCILLRLYSAVGYLGG